MRLASMDPEGTWYLLPRRTGLTGASDKHAFRQAFVVEETQRIMDMHPDWALDRVLNAVYSAYWLTQTYPQCEPSHAH